MTPKDLFEILVREHAEMLLLYLRCSVRDTALADDLFQETLLVAWKNLDRFDKSRPFGPWLRGIAGKLILAHRRKSAKGMLVCDGMVLEHLSAHIESLHTRPGDNLDEKLEDLRGCLEILPEPYREAVRLRYCEGLKGQSLAQRLAISQENMKKRLQRGREKLLRCLQRKISLSGAEK